MATRVYILAKELGVKSVAIVEKCQAEGLDVQNHMATISAGLAATIREWFSEGDASTSIETATPVDLKKVRVKRKKKLDSEQASVSTEDATEVETHEDDSEEYAEAAPHMEGDAPVAETAVMEEHYGEVSLEEPQAAEELEAPQEVQESASEEPAEQQPEPDAEEAAEVEEEKVVPAGPIMYKPAPAQLTGPRVVRFEKPEELRPIRPSAPRGGSIAPRGPRPPARPGVAPAAAAEAPAPVKGKGKGRAKTQGRHKDGSGNNEEVGSGKRRGQRDIDERRARLKAAEGERMRMRPSRRLQTDRKGEVIPAGPVRPQSVTIIEPVVVKDLAAALNAKITDIIGQLMRHGVMASANQSVAAEVAEMVALDMGVELVVQRRMTLEGQIAEDFEKMERKNLVKRPPVVTMLGHVDHGKTSLLDKIRTTHVASGEAGGITQHIGAYQVQLGEKKVTFLDTPGHEAFTAMRARGANMTDVVILVVAADDGVMPQTIEAIRHAQAAAVPIIVALNKSDLYGTDANRIYGQLAEHGLTPSAWGGDVEVVPTSATTGMGVNELLEYVDYIAELKDFKADLGLPASGWVVESKMSTTQGAVATLLIKEGTLNKGDIIVAGESYGRVRSMRDSTGRSIKEAGSSMPVEVSGLNGVPAAGDRFYRLDDINKAKTAAEESRSLMREETLSKRTQITLDNLFNQIAAGNIKELNVIIRADVQGSVDVLVKYLTDLSTAEVKVKVLHAAVGGITEGDVVLAEASSAIVIGFNVVPEDEARRQADSRGIDIRLYNIIYRITEDLKKAMAGLLDPEEQEKYLGQAEVRNLFKVTGAGTIAGCYVTDGIVSRDGKIRLTRDRIVLKDDCKISSLKHFKDDVREVRAGFECGIKVDGFDDIKIGDIFSVYRITKVARTL